jgi:redox-sensitive bicupin YhaK (pirin superfamily)
MTAERGIIHGEIPRGDGGRLQGFQLWVNLPRANKMMPPMYRDVRKETIPMVNKEGGEIKVIAGSVDGIQGPVRDLVVPVEYLDVNLSSGATFSAASSPGGHASPTCSRAKCRSVRPARKLAGRT